MLNIRDSLREGEEGMRFLNKIIRIFVCPLNIDLEHFLKGNAIDFTKRNQSVTYLVLTADDLKVLGYFTITIKPISVNAKDFSNNMRRRIERISEVNEQTGEYLLSAYLIAQLGKNFADDGREMISGSKLLQTALDTVLQLQYMAGGTASATRSLWCSLRLTMWIN